MAALLVLGSTEPGYAIGESIPYFDLGIDVTLLPQDRGNALAYFDKQAPETQQALRAACNNYVKHPADAGMPQTLTFCEFIMSPNAVDVPGFLGPFK